MTILRKGLLLIAVPLAFQLVFVGLLLRILDEERQAEQWAMQAKEVISRIEKAYGQLALVQAASRGYVVAAAEPFAVDEQAATDSARRQLSEIHGLLDDNPEQQARLAAIRRVAEDMIAWSAEQAQWARAGRRAESVERIAKLEGRQKLAATRRAIDDFLAIEEQLESQRTAELMEVRLSERRAIGFGTLGMTGITILAAYYYSRSISGRLAVVTKNAERLAENEPLASPVRGRDEIARLDRVVHEVSSRLRVAEEAEARFKTELEQRAAELAHTNESLRQQTQENEMFVYSVSHDLRSPLVNLQGFSKELEHAIKEMNGMLDDAGIPEDMRARLRDVMEQDVGASLKFIRTAVTRSSAIIDALLRLSRAGRVEYRWQSVDVAALTSRVVDAMQNTIRDRHAEIVVQDLAPAWGDPTAIEQMFGNLIGNAVNYLDAARPGRVEIGMTGDGRPDEQGLRTYYVKDTGLGIPAPYLAKVFIAFQRLHGEVARGEGIGLALVRRVVERHGGRVWVESTEGVGTTFYVALPTRSRETEG